MSMISWRRCVVNQRYSVKLFTCPPRVSNCRTACTRLLPRQNMRLSFRQRIFLILAALTAVPTVLGVIGWALAARVDAPSAGARVSFEEMAVSARQMLAHLD